MAPEEQPYSAAHASFERWRKQRDAADRVLAFLDAWEGRRERDDCIYAIGVVDRELPLELLASDLRTIAGAV